MYTVNEQFCRVVHNTSFIFHYTSIVSLILMSQRFDAKLTCTFGIHEVYSNTTRLYQVFIEIPINFQWQISLADRASNQNHFLGVNGLFAEFKRYYLRRD